MRLAESSKFGDSPVEQTAPRATEVALPRIWHLTRTTYGRKFGINRQLAVDQYSAAFNSSILKEQPYGSSSDCLAHTQILLHIRLGKINKYRNVS